ncbi:MAG: DCC1-like thiol-disulfide oxidoreductase family protein [Methylotetracoccus sp.]
MYRALLNAVQSGLARSVPATGLGIFRCLFALVALQEILFLYHFRHLIFDPLPYIDLASPSVHLFLALWAIAALFLALGYRTRAAAVANYLFWLVFTVFTPMWKDFDGGFDQLMLGSSLLLIFLPSERAFSLDRLRERLRSGTPGQPPGAAMVPVLAYFLPLVLSLGLIYLDSAIHKLSAPFWRHGLGPWLPSSMPYYMSRLDLTVLLEQEMLQRVAGYSIIAFQFLFLPLFAFRPFRIPLLGMGVLLHGGIIVALNIYPFGFGMLVHYALLVPFRWWRAIGDAVRAPQPTLAVYYDEQCPLCRRTALIIEHFDVRRAIAFKGAQSFARSCRELDGLSDTELLRDLYAVDRRGNRYGGIDTYIRILRHMGLFAPLGWILQAPGIKQLAATIYRGIADSRARTPCDEHCVVDKDAPGSSSLIGDWLHRCAPTPRQRANRIAKLLTLVALLQLNCTVHYAILYRLGLADTRGSEAGQVLAALSNGLITVSHTFLGITPHPLYLHDHFEGYEHLIGLTYRDADGAERWLPFIGPDGRMESPNWGRVHSMWANVAVTRHIDAWRLRKFVEKVTAFYGARLGLDLNAQAFALKLKEVRTPMDWEPGLRRANLDAPWRDVGTATWTDRTMDLRVTEDLPALSADR